MKILIKKINTFVLYEDQIITKNKPIAVIPAQKYSNFSRYSCINLFYTN